jgi:hypothetical protein
MKRIKRIILAFLILTAILLGALSQTVSEKPCKGITCSTIGCSGGDRHCHDIICPEGVTLICYMPK